MRKYQEYKSSGVDWLVEIPSNWGIISLKHLVKIKITDGPHETPIAVEDGIPFVSAEAVQNHTINFDSKWGYITIEDHLKYSKKCKPQNGDIFIVKSGATTGKVAYVNTNIEFNIWSPLALVRANEKSVYSRYLFNFIISPLFQGQVQFSWSFGTQQNIGMGVIQNLQIITPPLPEQLSIVRFLDHKTGQIDRFIANRQKQIELLKEQKAGIINTAVTKGINPNAKMKESRIEWIEEVPEHWMVGKVRRVLDILTDFTANGSFADLAKNVKYLDTPDYSRLIRLTDLREELKNDGIYVSKEAHEYLSKSVLHGGEILMANVGAYAGLVCLVPKIDFTATLGPNMFLLKFEEKRMGNQYAFTLLGSDCYYRLLMNKALSSAQPKLNKEDVKSIDFIFPPTHKEQQEILDFIQAETSNIDTLISKYQKQIDLMQEYRTSLISHTVTGKIDVRDWQPKSKEYKTEDLPLSIAAEN